ncbi:MAG: hypothetical protein AB1420_05825 [Bacillota bacterium]
MRKFRIAMIKATGMNRTKFNHGTSAISLTSKPTVCIIIEMIILWTIPAIKIPAAIQINKYEIFIFVIDHEAIVKKIMESNVWTPNINANCLKKYKNMAFRIARASIVLLSIFTLKRLQPIDTDKKDSGMLTNRTIYHGIECTIILPPEAI